jgi:hypothetical protein
VLPSGRKLPISRLFNFTSAGFFLYPYYCPLPSPPQTTLGR